jgi:hypothetical protein
MTDLASLTLAAVLSVARGPVAADRARLQVIAQDIAAVAESSGAGVFPGEGGRAALALMLVAIAKHESDFHPAIDTCQKRGDGGRSISMFQLLRGPNWAGHSADEICGDRRLAASIAAGVLARPIEVAQAKSFDRRLLTPQGLVNAYATGSPGFATDASREICAIWERLARTAGLAGAACGVFREYAAPAP